jgi:hypothetical protein
MDITNPPAPDAANRASLLPPSPQGLPSSNVAGADRASIRPLDVAAALKIMLAEVRTAIAAPDLTSELGSEFSTMEHPIQAARVLVNVFLQSQPDEGAELVGANQQLENAESALQIGLDRGISAVSAWQDVPSPVVDAARETRALVISVLGDEQQNPLWLRPEWAGLAPRLERLWRRRRLVRRRLTDPDYSQRRDETHDDRS